MASDLTLDDLDSIFGTDPGATGIPTAEGDPQGDSAKDPQDDEGHGLDEMLAVELPPDVVDESEGEGAHGVVEEEVPELEAGSREMAEVLADRVPVLLARLAQDPGIIGLVRLAVVDILNMDGRNDD